ncbi:hypothetical protein T484DRAFT_3606777 [Baffinella frigidus]|nr:hypothetical protein T484DRAFT_3606777 [Cryptophyta sp. CCMP2293]
MEGSPDVTAARAMAKHLGSVHHERLFTAEEAIAIVPKVVYHLETYETELIRSAIPNYFLAEITAAHVKVALTGEGADELFCGYLYFRDAPSSQALQVESRRIFHHLHKVNLQRADRMSMAHGLEAREPFLDVDFIDLCMRVSPEAKRIVASDPTRKHEKQFLREIFSSPESECTPGSGLIPRPLLFRTKAMQCEGVGTNWVERLQEHARGEVSDEEFASVQATFAAQNPPHTKEEAWYRRLFESHFPGHSRLVHVWEGGCRAGGAAWKSGAYTREGLQVLGDLRHSYMDPDGGNDAPVAN